MKTYKKILKAYCLTTCCSFIYFLVHAQDIITCRDGRVLKVKILESKIDTNKYIMYSDSTKIIYYINKEEVKSIVFTEHIQVPKSEIKTLDLNSQVPCMCDIITKINGGTIKATVLKFEQQYVVYYLSDDSTHTRHKIIEDSIICIIYKDGTKDVFNDFNSAYLKENIIKNNNRTVYSDTSREMYFKGLTDAGIYFRNNKAAGNITFLTTCVTSPLYGVIPALIFTNKIPADNKLGYPSQTLFNNPDYNRDYKDSVQKMISKKVWTNFATGSALYIGFYAAIILLSFPKK